MGVEAGEVRDSVRLRALFLRSLTNIFVAFGFIMQFDKFSLDLGHVCKVVLFLFYCEIKPELGELEVLRENVSGNLSIKVKVVGLAL